MAAFQKRTVSPAFRLFWWGYAVAVTLLSTLVYAGPMVEAGVFPVRVDNQVTDIRRSDRAVCWTWSSVKVRNRISDDVDVYLLDGQDRFVLSVYREQDGRPWSSGAALPIGPSSQRWCAALPPSVQPDVTVTIQWRAWYPGFLGLWRRIPLNLPDVVSPGAQP